MASNRQAIRGLWASRLSGLPTTGSNVFTSRVYPRNAMPCINITTPSDSELDTLGRNKTYTTTVLVVAHVSATPDADDILDDIAVEVENAVNSDVYFSRNAIYTELVGSTFGYIGGGSQPVAVMTMEFLMMVSRINLSRILLESEAGFILLEDGSYLRQE